uniref:Uncharacterized protein n=1 Tax=Arundo donax TaxID=35708 RepID=A0A0A8Y1U2_ARUDO
MMDDSSMYGVPVTQSCWNG